MAFVQLEDLHGSCEVIVFSKVFQIAEEMLRGDDPILVRGSPAVEGDDGEIVKVRAKEIQLLADVRAEKTSNMEISINTKDATEQNLQKLQLLLNSSSGHVDTRLKIVEPGVFETIIKLPPQLKTHPTDELLAQLGKLFGKQAVQLSC